MELGRRAAIVGAAVAMLAVGIAGAQPKERKPDLADAVAGTYAGDVISDSKGSSRSNVTLTLTRSGPNTVTVTSNYSRLPVINVPLEAVMGNIQHTSRADSVFVYNRAKKQLDVTFQNEVSWSGFKSE
ncbi:MAG: hypothetical protein KKA30_12590 [Alphaproteobacteria bacterium]|nr:hypothetical protein [Alphaproteobacteria bacterium]